MATGKPPLASMDRMAAMLYIGAHRGLMPPLPDCFSENAADFVRVCSPGKKLKARKEDKSQGFQAVDISSEIYGPFSALLSL